MLRVIRTRDHDWPGGWLTSARDFRVVKHAPAAYEFTMTEIIGTHEVVSLSSAKETFAMVIESHEYAQMQRNFFEVLWAVSAEAAVDAGDTSAQSGRLEETS